MHPVGVSTTPHERPVGPRQMRHELHTGLGRGREAELAAKPLRATAMTRLTLVGNGLECPAVKVGTTSYARDPPGSGYVAHSDLYNVV